MQELANTIRHMRDMTDATLNATLVRMHGGQLNNLVWLQQISLLVCTDSMCLQLAMSLEHRCKCWCTHLCVTGQHTMRLTAIPNNVV